MAKLLPLLIEEPKKLRLLGSRGASTGLLKMGTDGSASSGALRDICYSMAFLAKA